MPPCKYNCKSTENDGSTAFCCFDKGVVYAHPEKIRDGLANNSNAQLSPNKSLPCRWVGLLTDFGGNRLPGRKSQKTYLH